MEQLGPCPEVEAARVLVGTASILNLAPIQYTVRPVM